MSPEEAKRTARRVFPGAREEPAGGEWWERAEEGAFFSPEPGNYTLIIIEAPREVVNNFGGRTLQIPTNRGVLSTASFSVIRPLAKVVRERGGPSALKGARLSFSVDGEGIDRRYSDVTVQTGGRGKSS